MEMILLLICLAIGIALLIGYRIKENRYLKLEFRPRNPEQSKFDQTLQKSFQKAAEKNIKSREPKS